MLWGVPLARAASRGKGAPLSRRGHIDYINDAVSSEKRRRSAAGQPFARSDVREVRRRAKLAWDALPTSERVEITRGRSGAAEQVEHGSTDSRRGEAEGHDSLWGLAVEDSVLDPARLSALVQEALGKSVGAMA